MDLLKTPRFTYQKRLHNKRYLNLATWILKGFSPGVFNRLCVLLYFVFKLYFFHHICLCVTMNPRGGSRAAATSKMECFVTTVNNFQTLTIFTKHSILDVAAALDPPLNPSIISCHHMISSGSIVNIQ